MREEKCNTKKTIMAKIDISDMKNGIYILELIQNNNKIITKIVPLVALIRQIYHICDAQVNGLLWPR